MRLKELREKADKTQLEVCIALQTSVATVNRWEKGAARVPADLVFDMAKLYKVSPLDILQALKTKSRKGA